MLNPLGSWKDKIVDEVQTRVELFKLGVVERIARVLSYFIFILICIFLLAAVFIILGLSMGEYFAGLTDSYALGYVIAAGIYLVLFFILYLLRNTLSKAFADLFVRLMTDDDDETPKA